MTVRYIQVTGDGQKTEIKGLQPVTQAPAAPAPQRTPPPVDLNAIANRKQALQQELNAVQTAEQHRINAELEASRKQSQLAQEIAELERQEREAVVSGLVGEAQRVTANSAGNVAKLYNELETVVSALLNTTTDVNIKASFAHFVDAAQQAVAHSVPTDFDYGAMRRLGGNVLSQCGAPPVALLPAMKAWIAATKDPQQRQIRAGITLAMCGVVIRDTDLPADYNATDESAAMARTAAMPE